MSRGAFEGKKFLVIDRQRVKRLWYITVQFETGEIDILNEKDVDYITTIMSAISGLFNGNSFVVIGCGTKEGEKYVTIRLENGQIKTVKESEVTYDEVTQLSDFLQNI
ncbi:Glycerophosphoryl diester phosphodiesterase [Candida albicans]